MEQLNALLVDRDTHIGNKEPHIGNKEQQQKIIIIRRRRTQRSGTSIKPRGAEIRVFSPSRNKIEGRRLKKKKKKNVNKQ